MIVNEKKDKYLNEDFRFPTTKDQMFKLLDRVKRFNKEYADKYSKIINIVDKAYEDLRQYNKLFSYMGQESNSWVNEYEELNGIEDNDLQTVTVWRYLLDNFEELSRRLHRN